jgi:L-cystine uptake protein TcyP (sodium:dicarboxylate symporter family)
VFYGVNVMVTRCKVLNHLLPKNRKLAIIGNNRQYIIIVVILIIIIIICNNLDPKKQCERGQFVVSHAGVLTHLRLCYIYIYGIYWPLIYVSIHVTNIENIWRTYMYPYSVVCT